MMEESWVGTMRKRPTGVWPWIASLATACVCLLTAVNGQRDGDLLPVQFNLATRARISVNATCGERNREVFCKLVEHDEILEARNRHCDICDARNENPALRHPISNAVDGSQRWWQSPTLANGPEYNYVTITLDLQQVYQIAYIILKAANAPRPGNWILERSIDGETYLPWQYFAMNDQECERAYRLRATKGLPVFVRDDQVICTSRYSGLSPLEGGEIFVSLINERPGAYRPSKLLLEFTSARYIRMRFQKIRTLLGDLMDFGGRRPKDRDDTVTRRYFYSIKDISIGGQCICYGHARFCRRHDSMRDRLQCQCEDNTMGDNCELCKPLYNQKPWQVRGSNNGGCERCNCHNKADECVYNATVAAKRLSLNKDGMYYGGGVCLNCREYTTGINCEKCLPGYFQPLGITPEMRLPCRPCNCIDSNASTADCVQDDSRLSEGLRPGDCLCKEGYAGRLCDSCAVGYYGYPVCRRCLCDVAGSVDPENCDRQCVCKENVAGSRCDVCKRGYFNLDINNPLGCTKCFCFGVSDVCRSVDWGVEEIHDMNGWILSQLEPGGLTLLSRSFDGWQEAKVYLLEHGRNDPLLYTVEDIHYWVAPMSYLGYRLSSYGGFLKLTLRYRLDNQMRNRYRLEQPNFVLQGSNMTIAADSRHLQENRVHDLEVRLHESNWRHLEDNRPVTREEIMLLLYKLERLLIRATHNTAQDTVYLKDVYLDVASHMVMDGSSLKTVEECRCPEGYTGNSCESCDAGYRRVDNQLVRGVCRKCQCYNHSTDCDPYTGKCLECQHSTTGDNCESCLRGFYGDPRRDGCKPCSCPLVSGTNFFAESCLATPTRDNPDAYECVNCIEGYTGVRCERCAPGFFGEPIKLGKSCRRCSCGGNIECHPITGVCNVCSNNTEGKYCDRCISGYYGSAVYGDCRPCQCSQFGSSSQECDSRSGQCNCRNRFEGRNCDRCQRGYGNVAKGCERCDCDWMGSESQICDAVSGQCPCKPGVGGMSCSQCANGYYEFSRSGCKDCLCYRPGTRNENSCDERSGICRCKQGVIGQFCDKCMQGHFGLGFDEGCIRCDCDPTGSLDDNCDETSGQCSCRPGVGGRRCDSCLSGYYGFSSTGCQECKPCEKEGQVCDSVTGVCSCPTNTEGETCQMCITDAWGYDKDGGCKKNVEGQRCERCKPETFGLDRENPYGCTECYCFHRARNCSQAPYMWTTVNLPNLSTFIYTSPDGVEAIQNKFGHAVITSEHSYAHPEQRTRPVYWQLNLDELDSDMVLSYNGKLKFALYFDAPTPISKDAGSEAPLVILIGNGIELHHGDSHLERLIALDKTLRLHEDSWHFPGETQPVERRYLMIALQNVTAILVRAAQDGGAQEAFLELISIQRAVPYSPGVTSNETAYGVEICDCPERFSGESCQNPGPGYHRVPPIDSDINLSDPEGTIGGVRPCQCYRHSQLCNPDTGECEVCLHNTTGHNCERCAEGYYGVATTGTPDDCQPCSCPLPEPSNNFSPSCEEDRNGLVCTACRAGYEGMRCERCAPGFYGNPQKLGETCKPCLCNIEGSSGHKCDHLTGQCPCLPGITGRTCEVCANETTGVQDGACVSCYTGCTGVLLSELSNLKVPLLPFDPSTIVYPWDDLYNIQTQVKDLKGKLNLVEQAGGAKVRNLTSEVRYLDIAADRLINMTQYTCDNKLDTVGATACKMQNESSRFENNVTDLQKDVNTTYNEIRDTVDYIKNLTDSLKGDYQGLDMNQALQAAKDMLDEIRTRNFTEQDMAILKEHMEAEMLAEKIEKLKEKNINTNDAQSQLDELNRRLKDLLEKTQIADNTTDVTLEKIKQLMNLLETLNDIRKKINDVAKDSQHLLERAKNLTEEADSVLYVSDSMTFKLTLTLEKLRAKVDSLRRAIPTLETDVEKAMDHAEMLQKRAKELDDLYELVRNQSENAVKAAKAYESIVDAINEAKKSAEKALTDAQVSKQIAGVENMTDEVTRLIRHSKELKDEAEALLEIADELTDPLKNLGDELQNSQEDHEENQDLLNELMVAIDDLRKKSSNLDVNKTVPITEDAHKKINITFDILAKINRTQDESKLKQLKEDMTNITEEIEDARDTDVEKGVPEVKDLMQKVDEELAAQLRKAVDINHDLDKLKAKIRDARNRVNNMKLSLKSDGQCFRTYHSTLKPSATNEIRFAFKPESKVTDSLLVLLEQSEEEKGEEFLAADIIDGKVRFIWNSGSGIGSVFHDQDLAPDKWYHVMTKRIGSVGQLKVWSEDDQEEFAKKVSASLGAGCSLMNLNEKSKVYLAGSGTKEQIPLGVSRKNFTGCMGEILLDAHRLGVYNFKSNEEDHCDACEEVPQQLIAAQVYVFNGRGFARYEVGRYHARRTKVELEFKTFYEDSRIFFVGSESNGDYLSIDLEDGHVTVRFYMGGISAGYGETINTYNNNKWIRVIFDRNKLNAALIVGDEKIMISAPGANTGLDISGAPMYFGGLPTTLDVKKFSKLKQNGFFYGCMQKLTFYTLPPESDSSSFVNVQKSSGCRENGISTVDFRGTGYLALRNENIDFKDEKNDVSLTFITRKENAVILLARDIQGNNYYSISLVDGHLEALIKGEGNNTISLRSRETFNDGTTHCISLIKDSQRFKLLANDQVLGDANAIDLQFPSPDQNSLYLGGYPVPNILDMAPTNEKFDGCISDVIINGNLLSMGDATQYKRADVGRCRFTTDTQKPVVVASENTIEPTTTPAPQPLALVEPQSCAAEVKPEVEANAHSVGLSDSFHAEITKIKRRDIAKSFNFTFEFRTFYEDGLFGYLTNTDKTFYLGVQLIKGRLEVAYMHEGSRVSISFDKQLNDGLWHSVQLEKAGDNLALAHDDEPKSFKSIDSRLDVRPPLYLGGPQDPEDFKKNDINLVTHSVRGCIRDLEVNQKEISIIDVKVIQDAGDCFKNVEPGIYFNGNAWAAYESQSFIQDPTTMSLDFKTTSREGILVSVGSRDDSGHGLTLELHKGKVKFGLRNKDGEFRIETDNTNEFAFCDNQWHTVKAAIINSQLSIKVDGGDVLSTPVTGMSEVITISNLVFIGGHKSTPSEDFKQPVSLSQDTLNGCLKKLVINGKTIDWYKLTDQFGVKKNACPKD